MKISDEAIYEYWLDPLKIQAFRQLKIGGVLTERRLAKYIGTSHVTASSILQGFAKDFVARSQRVGRANLWSLNTSSYGYQVLEQIVTDLDKIISPRQAFRSLVRETI